MRTTLQRIYSHSAFPIMLLACYMLILGADAGLVQLVSKEHMKGVLIWVIPLALKANLLLLVMAALACWTDMAGAFKRLLNGRGILLAAVVLCGFLLTSLATVRTHRIYYDEDIYANEGQNIASTGQAAFTNYGEFEYGEYHPLWIEYNKEPAGWPFLISLAFDAAGVREQQTFILNNLLFAGGILLVFFIAYGLSGQYHASLFAAIVYALIPHNLIWSNTGAAEPSAAFFAGLSVLCLITFIGSGHTRHLLLTATVLPLASQMRPESMLIIVWAGASLLLLAPRLLSERRLWTAGLVVALFISPHILHLYAVSGQSWGAEGAKFSLGFLPKNLETNGMYYLNGSELPLLFTILAGVGLAFARSTPLRRRLSVFLWFALFWGIFLFFYAGSYHYGADVRFALLSFMPLSVLSGMGCAALGELAQGWLPSPVAATGMVLALILLFSTGPLHRIRQEGQEAWGSRYDHNHAWEFIQKVPRRSIILTQTPTMFLLWGQNAIQTSAGINNPILIRQLMLRYRGHVYFHYGYWCNTNDDRNVKLCRQIADTYTLKEVARAEEQSYEYALYQMVLK